MIIDRKFKIQAENPCNGKIYTEHDAVLFCAEDAALPAALIAYRKECIRLGCGDGHVENIALLLDRVVEFQRTVERRVPDTDEGCELDRCIGGIGLEDD